MSRSRVIWCECVSGDPASVHFLARVRVMLYLIERYGNSAYNRHRELIQKRLEGVDK